MIGIHNSEVENYFRIGKLAAALIPAWLESDLSYHKEFDGFLCASGMPHHRASRVAELGLTYYEVPSLAIWKQQGYHQTACAARLSQDGCREILVRNGATVLDLLTML